MHRVAGILAENRSRSNVWRHDGTVCKMKCQVHDRTRELVVEF